ncbi:28751_t:CDS:2, partial [Gigaspora margarita]
MEISEEDYKTIKENSSSSKDQIEIEKKNRLFLEDYWEVHGIITYWYGHYLYNRIG